MYPVAAARGFSPRNAAFLRPDFIGISTLVDAASGDLVLTEPASVQAGDLFIACIGCRSNAAFTLPTDWALVGTQQSSGNTTENTTGSISSGVMAYIVRGAGIPDLTFTRTVGDIARGQIVAYRNNTATPYNVGSANTLAVASATITMPGMITTQNGELVVMMVAGARNSALSGVVAANGMTGASGATDVTTDPTDNAWIERADSGTTTGADVRLGIFDAVMATAGDTGTITATQASSARHVMIGGAFFLTNAHQDTETFLGTNKLIPLGGNNWLTHNSGRSGTFAKFADNQPGRFKFVTAPGDEWINDAGRDPPHERSELVLHPGTAGNQQFAYGVDIWESYHQKIDGADFEYFDTYPSTHRTVGQWHAEDSILGYSPIIGAEIDDNGDYFIFTRYDLEGDIGAAQVEQYRDTAFVLGRWYYHVRRLKFGTNGAYEHWRRDCVTNALVKLVDQPSGFGLGYPGTDTTPYPTHGLYRTKSLDTMTLWVDNVRDGTVDLSGLVTSPPSIAA